MLVNVPWMRCSGMVITWDCQFCGLFFNFVGQTVLRSPLKNRQAVYGVPYASTARDLVAVPWHDFFKSSCSEIISVRRDCCISNDVTEAVEFRGNFLTVIHDF